METLHWHPQITLDVTPTKETFKASDQKGEFIIVAQGMRRNGDPIFGSIQFQVE